jgi:hypothetical protein
MDRFKNWEPEERLRQTLEQKYVEEAIMESNE